MEKDGKRINDKMIKRIFIIKSARNRQVKEIIKELRYAFPTARLCLLIHNKFKEEFKECEIISYPDEKKFNLIWIGRKNWKHIRNFKPNMTVICYNHSIEWGSTYLWVELIAFFSGAKWIGQFWKKGERHVLTRFELGHFILSKFKYWLISQYLNLKALREISQYTGENIKIVYKKIKNSAKEAVDSWQDSSPESEEEIKEWYSKTDIYIYQLMRGYGYYPGSRLEWLSDVLTYCKGKKKVLDYGCGVGHFGVELVKRGFEVTNADLPGKTFDFVKWRYQKMGIDARFVDLNNNSLPETYEVILCTDVLEHLPDPVSTLKCLYQHLKNDGVLLVKMGEEETLECPLHLGVINQSNYFSIMVEIGFMQITKERSDDIWKLIAWKKV